MTDGHVQTPSATVMIIGFVGNKGNMMPLYFFPQGLRVNSFAYSENKFLIVK